MLKKQIFRLEISRANLNTIINYMNFNCLLKFLIFFVRDYAELELGLEYFEIIRWSSLKLSLRIYSILCLEKQHKKERT